MALHPAARRAWPTAGTIDTLVTMKDKTAVITNPPI